MKPMKELDEGVELSLRLMDVQFKHEGRRLVLTASFLLFIVAIGMSCAPAQANQNVVCSQFNRYGMTLDREEVVGYTLRSSHPSTAKSIQKLMDLLPPTIQYAHGKAYGEHMRAWCSSNPNEGSWQASIFAYQAASDEVFK